MRLMELENDCLTCSLQPGCLSLNTQNELNRTISDVLRKHFWFTEDDFRRFKICESCWDQVNHFHQFYIAVEKLYQNRLVSMALKTEPEAKEFMVMIPEVPDHRLIVKSETLEGSTILVKEEPAAEINDENSSESSDEDEQDPIDDQNKQETPGDQSREQRLMEDEYIKQHVKYICEKCSNESDAFVSLIKHMRNNHRGTKPSLMCCGRNFYRRYDLYSHVKIVNNPAAFRCEPCHKNFMHRWGLVSHMKEFHAGGDERRYKCNQCPKSFMAKALYKKHVQDHKKSIKCEHCGRFYKTRGILSTHVTRMHPELFDYLCNICNKSFRKESGLRRHKLKHEESGEQGLKEQGKSKNTDTTVVKAAKVKARKHRDADGHKGLTAYKCQFCEKMFNSSQNMTRHQRRMHSNESREWRFAN